MFVVFFCFKQKTAYEMRISDWSSDVCFSDLLDVDIRIVKFSDDIDTLHRCTMKGRLAAILFVKDVSVYRIRETELNSVRNNDLHFPTSPMSFSISCLLRYPKEIGRAPCME